MKTDIIIKYKMWECEIEVEEYMNGGTCIEFVDIETDEPILTATVSVCLDSNEVVIDDAEIRELMVKKGLIEVTDRLSPLDPSWPVCTIVEPRMMHSAAI